MLTFEDSTNSKNHLLTLRRNTSTLPLEKILARPPRNPQRWLQLARLGAARATGRGTRQHILSTFFTTNGDYVTYSPTATSIQIVLISRTSSTDPWGTAIILCHMPSLSTIRLTLSL